MTAQSATPTLTAQRRDVLTSKAKHLRAEGMLPAVMYGNKKETVALTVDHKTFVKLYNEVGSSTLVNLKVDDDSAVKVLIHDIAVEPTKNLVRHADFYIVNLKEKLRTEIPLSFTGVADAVDVLGGTLLHVMDEIEVECLPDALVSEIEVDLSTLKTFDDTITVADIKLPAGMVAITDVEQTVVSVTEPRSEEEMAELDEAPATEVETEFETTDGTVKPEEEPAE